MKELLLTFHHPKKKDTGDGKSSFEFHIYWEGHKKKSKKSLAFDLVDRQEVLTNLELFEFKNDHQWSH